MVAPRSTLPVSGKYVLIGAAVAAVLVSLRFVMIGAWPVLVFALLDIGALAVALYIFGRRPVPEERISLVDGRIELVRIDGSGRRDRLELPAFWTRLEASGRTELDCDLHLVFRQHRYPVGRCVSAAARRSLIPQIEALLACARQP
ncbi:DUF2244 domain-containing protein [Rhizorhabdus sp. FW153]|uniref:DUF2244 domain-containing protein n=1 Tax=Rhizorhabdus sp. FW153 TaxID=3400216 RepID=UPI003CE7BD82